MSRPRPPVPAPAALLTNVSVLAPVSRVTFWSLCVLVVRSAHPRGTAGTRRCLVSRVPADCPRHQLLLGMAAVCRFVCGAARRRSLSQLVVWTCASLCLCGGPGEPSGVPASPRGSPCGCMQMCTAVWDAVWHSPESWPVCPSQAVRKRVGPAASAPGAELRVIPAPCGHGHGRQLKNRTCSI